MTAEVAIITRQAIALAADSAVTVGREKVWKTANKLFSLGPKHDIAVMVYGSGDFLGLSWEVVIKEYRRRAATKDFATVADCAADLRAFLQSSTFAQEKQQRASILFPLFDLIANLSKETKEEDGEFNLDVVRAELDALRSDIKAKGSIFAEAVPSEVTQEFETAARHFSRDDDYFGPQIGDALSDDFAGLARDFFVSKHDSQYSSGLVVAGFGTQEFFPSLLHHAVDGRWGDHLRWWEDGNCKNLNDPEEDDDFPIIPFAQQDMPFLFMSGISSAYLSFLNQSLAGIMEGTSFDLIRDFVPADQQDQAKAAASDLAQKTSSAFMERLFDKVRREQFLPIKRAVLALPKEEMALMAEALVDITSLKRKVDSRLETVGGPVDVAVISKGDGFVWIKRKFYFKPELNHDFLIRKRTRLGETS